MLGEDKKMLEAIIERYKMQQKVLQDESNQYRISFQRSNRLNLELNKQIRSLQKDLNATMRRLQILQQMHNSPEEINSYTTSMATGIPSAESSKSSIGDVSSGPESRVTFSDEDPEVYTSPSESYRFTIH